MSSNWRFKAIGEIVRDISCGKIKNIILPILLGFDAIQLRKLIQILVNQFISDPGTLVLLLEQTQINNPVLYGMLTYRIAEYILGHVDQCHAIVFSNANFQADIVRKIAERLINYYDLHSKLTLIHGLNPHLCDAVAKKLATYLQESAGLDQFARLLNNNVQLASPFVLQHFAAPDVVDKIIAKNLVTNLDNLYDGLKFIGEVSPQLQKMLCMEIVGQCEKGEGLDINRICLDHPGLSWGCNR